jgi:hypothetical protein
MGLDTSKYRSYAPGYREIHKAYANIQGDACTPDIGRDRKDTECKGLDKEGTLLTDAMIQRDSKCVGIAIGVYVTHRRRCSGGKNRASKGQYSGVRIQLYRYAGENARYWHGYSGINHAQA